MTVLTEIDYERDWDAFLQELPDSSAGLERELAHGRADGDPLCPLARPRLLSPFSAAADRALSEFVVAALSQAVRLVTSDSVLWNRYLSDLEGSPGPLAPKGTVPVFHGPARLRGLRAGGALRFFSYRAGGALEALAADALAGIFARSAAMDAFRTRHLVTWPACAERLLEVVIVAHRGNGADLEPASLHLLPGVGMYGGTGEGGCTGARLSHWAARAAADRGVTLVPVDPAELAWDGSRLECGDTVVRVVVADTCALASRADGAARGTEALTRAQKAGAVALLGAFGAGVLEAASLFAVLTGDRCDIALPPALRRAVDVCMPWTRVVADEASTNPDGDRVDLLAWTTYNREDLVLKPSLPDPGTPPVVGASTIASRWAECLAAAVADARTWVVQERIRPQRERLPGLEGGHVTCEVQIDSLLWSGAYVGGAAWASPIERAARPRGLVPMFVAD